jgi:hypothetical protein
MYKKVTKIKRVTKKFSSPFEENDNKDDLDSKAYDNNITMDIPFFIKLIEHVHTKITTPIELQTLAENVVNLSKPVSYLSSEEFEKLL